MSYVDKIRTQIADEQKAYNEYIELAIAMRQDPSGLYTREAEIIERMATDELTHYNMLRTMLSSFEKGESYSMYEHRMESLLGHVHPSQQRRFPQTYEEWENLVADINKHYLDDPATRAMVNYQLHTIGGQYETPEAVSEAKRWLTWKAGELGRGY